MNVDETCVIVVGLGQSGVRFMRACLTIGDESNVIRIVGVVDPDAKKLEQFRGFGIPFYRNLADLPATLRADIAIVATPEQDHYATLIEIRHRIPTIRVLCEKPLAASASEAQRLSEVFQDADISINFVERFSPMVARLINYIDQHQRRVSRANFFWGKPRIKDPRPSAVGVIADICHPLDLVLLLGKIPVGTAWEVVSVLASKSNFSIGDSADEILDTLHLGLKLDGGMQVFGASSYLWSARQRKLELLLSDSTGAITELAVLVFDTPIWDVDQLCIYDVSSVGGQLKLIHSERVEASFWPPERLTIGKVCRFIEANLCELRGGASPLMPRLDQGVYIQTLLEEIVARTEEKTLRLSNFREPVTRGEGDLRVKLDLVERLRSGLSIAKEEYIWDGVY
jgi:predicted dehydrogenase